MVVAIELGAAPTCWSAGEAFSDGPESLLQPTIVATSATTTSGQPGQAGTVAAISGAATGGGRGGGSGWGVGR